MLNFWRALTPEGQAAVSALILIIVAVLAFG